MGGFTKQHICIAYEYRVEDFYYWNFAQVLRVILFEPNSNYKIFTMILTG